MSDLTVPDRSARRVSQRTLHFQQVESKEYKIRSILWRDSSSSTSETETNSIYEDVKQGLDQDLDPTDERRGSSSVDKPKSKDIELDLDASRRSPPLSDKMFKADYFVERSTTRVSDKIINVAQFTLFCLGFGVGLGNLWRFPNVAYKHGGGSFLLAYSIFVAVFGIPLFFLELTLGQYISSGPGRCWQFCPIFKGIGLAMAVLSLIVAIPNSMTITLAFHYLSFSFTNDLPWLKCNQQWATPDCKEISEDKVQLSGYGCNDYGFNRNSTHGACPDEELVDTDFDKTLSGHMHEHSIISSEEYFHRFVIGSQHGNEQVATGRKEWTMLLCYICGWCIVSVLISKGLRPAAKIISITAFLPYMTLVIFLVTFINLEGASVGVQYYFNLDQNALLDHEVWVDAAVEVLYSLSVTFGGLIMLASLNPFHSDCLQYTFILTLCNYCTSLLAGLVVFCCIGVLADQDPTHTFKGAGNYGPELIFIVYPMALNELPIKPIWSVLFFATLIIVGMNNQLILLNTTASSLKDMIPLPTHKGWVIPTAVCIVCSLLGLVVALEDEIHLYVLIDTYAVRTNGFVIAFCACVALVWIYGLQDHLTKIETMIGEGSYFCIPWAIWKWWWALCWGIIIPVVALSLIVLDLQGGYASTHVDNGTYKWLIWTLRFTALVIILGSLIAQLVSTPGTLLERLQAGIEPSDDFAPALPSHRASVLSRNPSVAFMELKPQQLNRIQFYNMNKEMDTDDVADSRGSASIL